MKTMHDIKATKGNSYFGSGGYSSGWKVIEGQIEETPIAGSEYDNGFIQTMDYLLRPKTPVAVLRLWHGDGLSNSGRRALGLEGLVVLTKDDSPGPEICPHCGHIVPRAAIAKATTPN